MSSDNAPSIAKGWMRFYSAFRPALFADQYEVTLQQSISDGNAQGEASGKARPDTDIADEKRYFDVTGPRFSLPKTEIHSVFPPANSSGAFSQRLAHIALKRRTLPWERSAEADAVPEAGKAPWLALVLLADGEANFMPGQTVEDLKSKLPASLVSQLDIQEEGQVDILQVTRRVVDAAFPAKKELPFLSHVRQVNIQDTEAAQGDEDGFMSIVLSNRLPQPGVTYKAYLISLEGRLDDLPTWEEPAQPELVFTFPLVYWDVSFSELQNASLAGYSSTRMDFSDAAVSVSSATSGPSSPVTLSPFAAAASTGGPNTTGSPALDFDTSIDELSARGARSFDYKASANPWANKITAAGVSGQVQAASAPLYVLSDMNFELYDPGSEKLHFPVLASWAFSCQEGGDFEALMQNLDNGLLGKAPENQQYGPPAPMTDTGHTVVDHVIRRGEKTRSWYRGAFTPREIVRRLRGAPFFSADQARRIAEDGREDISDAAAFELGRLLALSDPAYAQAMASWRRTGFRLGRMFNKLDLLPQLKLKDDEFSLFDSGLLNRMLRLNLLKDVLKNEAKPLGPQICPCDAAWTFTESDMGVISRGFGLSDETQVSELLGEALTGLDVDPQQVGGLKENNFERLAQNPDAAFADLKIQLDSTVQGLSRDTGGRFANLTTRQK